MAARAFPPQNPPNTQFFKEFREVWKGCRCDEHEPEGGVSGTGSNPLRNNERLKKNGD